MALRTITAILLAVTLAGCAAAKPPATVEPATEARAEPQSRCARAQALLKVLADNYGERPAASGVTRNGNRMIVTASGKGAWTLLVIVPHERGEIACVASTGEGWHSMPRGPQT